MRIYWKLVLIIFAAQFLLGSWEALTIVQSHRAGSEYWPLFFIFVVNLPASILAADLVGVLDPFLSFYPRLVASLVVYVLIGTLWWSLLTHLVLWLSSWTIRSIRRVFKHESA